MDDDNVALIEPVADKPAAECKHCGKPARLYNLCGQEEMLCEDDYERQLSIYNDLGSN